ncbi:MAG TPA: hypothetical protein VL306_02005 [Methylomirabilota bacterium]|nr:hypothetical protein [Methylomirabilota bacterium]
MSLKSKYWLVVTFLGTGWVAPFLVLTKMAHMNLPHQLAVVGGVFPALALTSVYTFLWAPAHIEDRYERREERHSLWIMTGAVLMFNVMIPYMAYSLFTT